MIDAAARAYEPRDIHVRPNPNEDYIWRRLSGARRRREAERLQLAVVAGNERPLRTSAMIDHVLHPAVDAGAVSRVGRFAARLGRSLCGALLMRRRRQALGSLPEDLLVGIGLTSDDVAFIADALADAPSDRSHQPAWATTDERDLEAAAGRI